MSNDEKRAIESLAGKVRRLSRGFADDVTRARDERLGELVRFGGHLLALETYEDGGAWFRVELASHRLAWLEFTRSPDGRRRGAVRLGSGAFRMVPVSPALAACLEERIEGSATTRTEYAGGYRLTA